MAHISQLISPRRAATKPREASEMATTMLPLRRRVVGRRYITARQPRGGGVGGGGGGRLLYLNGANHTL